MNMGSGIDFFSIFLLLCGGYILYAGIIMKTEGKITKSIMLGGQADANNLKDKEGFIKYMFPRTLIIGICTCLCAAWGFVAPMMENSLWGDIIVFVVFTVLIIYYMYCVKKAGKLYC